MDRLETRTLFATLVVDGGSGDDVCIFDVTGGFINASMNGFNIPQPVSFWDDVQINLKEGDDIVEIRNTGDEPVNISLGSGTDFVQITPTTDDLDSIGARVHVLAGTDAANDLVEVFDIGDSGDDSYTILDDGPMKLRKAGVDKVWWGESNIGVSVFLNDGNNTVTVDSSVSMTGTDESLAVGGQGPGFGGGNDTCHFNGVLGADNTFRFNGGTGSDILNVTGNNFSGSDAQIFMDGGNSTGDTLNISDASTTDEYIFNGNGDNIDLFLNNIQSGRYQYVGTEAINLNITASGADTFDIEEVGASTVLSIDAGDGDDEFVLGDGSIDNAEFGANVDIFIDGGTGADDLTIADNLTTVARTHTWTNDQYDHINIGLLDLTSITDVLLSCGSAGDTIDVNFNPGMSGVLTVNGNGGADSFEATPDFFAALELNGGTPGTSPGDVLTLDVGSLTGGVFTPGGAGAGTYDFPSPRQLVDFTGMENFPTAPAAPGAPDLSGTDDTGTSPIDNITGDTSLTFTGTGAAANSSVELFRDGTSVATTTASAGGVYSFTNVAFATGDDTFAMTVRYHDPASGLLSNASGTLNVRVDTIAPAAPTIPNLATSSDTGISTTDGVTNDNTPQFDGTVPANEIVRIFADAVLVGSDTTTGTGAYSVTTSALAEGVRIMTARTEDLAGNQSALTPPAVVVIDTIAPASPTVAPDLTAASDTGTNSSDNITRDNTPAFSGTAPGNTVVRLLSGGVEVGFAQVPVAGTTYTVTSSVLADGVRLMTTRFEDFAGNVSASASPTLAVVIDTAAPLVTSADFNFQTSQNLRYTFNENVGASLAPSDLTLTNTTTSTAITTAVTFAGATGTFTWPSVGSILPDGDYSATLSGPGVTDIAGNALPANHLLSFFFLNGDADRDRDVDSDDFNALASNFGQSGRTFSQGNFSYDPAGLVNSDDFNIQATRFGVSLAPGISGRGALRGTPAATGLFGQIRIESKPAADELVNQLLE